MRWGTGSGVRGPGTPGAAAPDAKPAQSSRPWLLAPAGLLAVLIVIVLLVAVKWIRLADLAGQVLAELFLLAGVSTVAALARRRTRR
jgi:hypothetical protein